MTSQFMMRALELARSVQGSTNPNPPVGAVLVRRGRIVGEGATRPPGGDHAEIVALRDAGALAHGSTLYVTLEPCSHWGRTPPCAGAVIEAGVSKAHIAALDPNPRVDGAGVHQLRAHGIEVVLHDGEDEAVELIEAHIVYTREERPHVTLMGTLPADVRTMHQGWSDVLVRAEENNGPIDIRVEDRRADTRRTNDPLRLDTHVFPRAATRLSPDGRVTVYRNAPGPAPSLIHHLLETLCRHEVSSCLIETTDIMVFTLAAAMQTDTIVTDPRTPVPPGFAVRALRQQPSPHRILVPASV